jgi:hypothetical protein
MDPERLLAKGLPVPDDSATVDKVFADPELHGSETARLYGNKAKKLKVAHSNIRSIPSSLVDQCDEKRTINVQLKNNTVKVETELKMLGTLMAREVLYKDEHLGLRPLRCACHPCMWEGYKDCTAKAYTLGEPTWSKYVFV